MVDDTRPDLGLLPAATVAGIRCGLEKEGLRVTADGRFAMTPHPQALGAPLFNPYVTLDFSRSQPELVTGVHDSPEAAHAELRTICAFVAEALGEELLWPASMPGDLPTHQKIPLAEFGRTNAARLKRVYRRGLGVRYSRRMQTICGLHYNMSAPGLTTDDYLTMVRNFRQVAWLPMYLFGASPAAGSRFVRHREHHLRRLGPDTVYLPEATSLRMGPLGYQSSAQSSIGARFNSLDAYLDSLEAATRKPYPPYEVLRVFDEDGRRQQLSSSVLQLEDEFYGPIRPKRAARAGERSIQALRRGGIEYVEVRCLDLNPFVPTGIDTTTMRFINLLLLWALATPSSCDSAADAAEVGDNLYRVADMGRRPRLWLERNGERVPLVDWAGAVLAGVRRVAEHVVAVTGDTAYLDAVAEQEAKLADPGSLPSARVLDALCRDHGGSYVEFGLAQARACRESLIGPDAPAVDTTALRRAACESLAALTAAEACDEPPFEEFLAAHLAATR